MNNLDVVNKNNEDVLQTKVLIIGSGPAGYTAAIYAARACLEPIMVAGSQRGGQLTITTDVENYPGFADTIQGPWLMEQMHEQAKNVGTTIIDDMIESVDFAKRPFTCYGSNGQKYLANTIIIATGAEAKWLGLESETKYRGFGVSGCATCDGFFYRGKTVMVVGGGNTAVEEALYLTNHAKEVLLIHRKDQLRAEKVLQKRLHENSKIKILWNRVLVEVIGQENPKFVTEAKIKNLLKNEEEIIKVDGIFIAIGHKPNTGIFQPQYQNVTDKSDDINDVPEKIMQQSENASKELENSSIYMDDEGYIITKPGTTQTNIPGVFAAGDVQDKIYRQAVTAAGTGCMAALEAEKFIASGGA